MLPTVEEVIEAGESSLLGMKAQSNTLRDSLSENLSSVDAYFASLQAILNDRKKSILHSMTSQANWQERIIQRRVVALDLGIDAMKKTKLTVEDTIETRSEDIKVLLEENRLRSRIRASMKLVKDEMLDCKAEGNELSSIVPFTPDASLKAKCEGIEYTVRQKKRSNTTFNSPARSRAGAFIGVSPMTTRATSKTISGRMDFKPIIDTLPTKSVTLLPATAHAPINCLDPIFEIGTKNLIGSYNNVTAYPFGICCTKAGALLVTDTRHHLFRIMTATGKCLETVGIEGKGEGQFLEPTGITVDRDDNTLVLDGKNPGRLQKFSETGLCIIIV